MKRILFSTIQILIIALAVVLFTIGLVPADGSKSMPGISGNIGSTGFNAIRLPAGYGCSAYSIYSAAGSSYYKSHNSAGDSPIIVYNGEWRAYGIDLPPDDAGTILFWAKTLSGNDTLYGELLPPTKK